ncbi:MAG TPA: asparagine synthase-related protein [Sphingomicrobium sp.]|nr:asparagine synthase-related protein [Sphingomicrobium sp.]
MGSLFRRQGLVQPLTSLSAREAATAKASGGFTLPSNFWGGYIAAVAGPDAVNVLRDASGTFPCYHAKVGCFEIFASDAELLVASGVRATIDFEEVGRQLFRAFVPSPATALREIRELLAGFVLQIPALDARSQACWSPWDHVGDPDPDPETTAKHLACVVRRCVRGWASRSGRILLSVSGGLDSSIIAACLAQGRLDAVCLTMFADDPAGDERPFARALCNHLGLRLVERPYRLEDIDITEALGAHLPRPRDRTQANAYERVHLEVAEELGADAFMTGNGGDNVFGYSQSAAPIADRYLSEGLGRGLARSLFDVCEQTGCSVFDAAKKAWRLTRGSPAHPIKPNPLFLDPDFLASLGGEVLLHPWLDAPPGARPGKAAHISAILRAQPNLEASRGYRLPVFSPLMSQPIVETCLQIPTWEWRAGGRDRAVARRAFASDLPPAILNRRVKGTPSRFAARLLDHFRSSIRERLLGGRLARHRIIDKLALERQLLGERPVPDLERVRILELVNVEAWLDHWAIRGEAPEPAETHIKSVAHDRRLSSSDPIP